MEILSSIFTHHMPLVMLWFGCLALYLPLTASKPSWRLCIPPLFLMVFGYLLYWFPLYQAGGGPGFFGTYSTDTTFMAGLTWVVLVLPATALLAPPLAFAEYLRHRTIKERARGSSLGLTRTPR